MSVAAPRIKICGLTRASDAALAAELGAWALGFIFHPASPRAVAVDVAAGIVRGLGLSSAKKVGVFVDVDPAEIAATVQRVGLTTVQLHGDETPEFVAALAGRLSGVGMIKALRPRSAADLASIAEYGPVCEAVLLDAYVPGVPGGTGQAADWALAAQAASGSTPVILAGGLNPGNIRAALGVPGIHAVDASSGLEEAPGRKSSDKLKAFFANANGDGRS